MHLLVADSWLTVGVTDGTPDTVSSVGIDFSEWSNTQGIEVTQGSVFWLDLDKAPKKGGRDITIAQLTVPAGASFDGKVNAQGSTVAGAKSKHWDARNIAFHGGPEKVGKSCNAPADCPSCEDPMVRTCGKSNTCSCKLKHCTGTSCCSTCKHPPPPGPKSPPPTPKSKSDATPDSGGGGSTGIVVFILLLAIVGGTFLAKHSHG